MKRLLFISSVLMMVMVSCQKEIDLGTGANSFGDLLIKIQRVTPASGDTSIVNFQWDALRRLVKYSATGEVDNTPSDFTHVIARAADGKILRINSESAFSIADSIAYFPYYQSGSSRLAYVIDSQYTFAGTIMDSMVYTYNGGGRIIEREIFSGLPGFLFPTGKQAYTYDGNGNLTVIIDSIPDGVGGYDLSATTTITFDSHRPIYQAGEEAFIIADMDPVSISKNNSNKQTKVDALFPGNSYTATGSQYQFNAADKPIKFTMSMIPQPPGYDMKLTMFYQ
ncbi:MAG: hypothetical protein HOP10_16835 [Chitinophagaceae bacterium]|nr:hypothetical protein [Chitinophagaceae bacterium]